MLLGGCVTAFAAREQASRNLLAWVERERGALASWLPELPKCPCDLRDVIADPGHWSTPSFDPPFHTPPGRHVFGTRSLPMRGAAGNQCIFDAADSTLVTELPFVGTPDRISPRVSVGGHKRVDLDAYATARFADGEAQHYVGEHVRAYILEARPPWIDDACAPEYAPIGRD